MNGKNWKFKSGITLIIISIFFFIFLPIIPFLELSNRTKITLSSVVFILAEVLFYLGGFLVGKELIIRYKSYLHPKNWFRKNKNGLE